MSNLLILSLSIQISYDLLSYFLKTGIQEVTIFCFLFINLQLQDFKNFKHYSTFEKSKISKDIWKNTKVLPELQPFWKLSKIVQKLQEFWFLISQVLKLIICILFSSALMLSFQSKIWNPWTNYNSYILKLELFKVCWIKIKYFIRSNISYKNTKIFLYQKKSISAISF